jgi:hypothetical protein
VLVKGKTIHLGDLVWILWEDHYGAGKGGWIDKKKIEIDPMFCETVGWVVAFDKGRIATVQSHDGQYPDPFIHNNYSVSPKRMIVDIKVLQKRNKKWIFSD